MSKSRKCQFLGSCNRTKVRGNSRGPKQSGTRVRIADNNPEGQARAVVVQGQGRLPRSQKRDNPGNTGLGQKGRNSLG